MIAVDIIQTIFIFGIPLLILNLRKNKVVKLVGMVGVAYICGILVSLLIFLFNTFGVEITLSSDISEIGSYVAIAVAIPLLLFNANLKESLKLSKTIGKAMLALLISLILVMTIVFIIFNGTITNANILSGMAVGLYTGGTPNLNAIGATFGLNNDIVALANLSDMIIGGIFYAFVLVAAKPFLNIFLKKYKNDNYLKSDVIYENYESLESVPLKNVKGVFFCVLLSLLMTLASALIGVVIWYMLGAKDGELMTYLVPALLIGVTVFGIIGSFNKNIQNVKGNNLVGQYLILVFSFALASALDLTKIGSNFINLFMFFGLITIGTFIVNILFSKLFKIDTDCTLIVLIAGIYGPAFVPAVAKQIKNEKLVVPGLIVGSIGYAVGTFLGIGVGLLFGLFI